MFSDIVFSNKHHSSILRKPTTLYLGGACTTGSVSPDYLEVATAVVVMPPTLIKFRGLVGWLVLLLYVPSQQLWSLRDGQFT